ncbi:MAG TPA: class I SAM-dependent methyltransferase [Stellaceae bacterium]
MGLSPYAWLIETAFDREVVRQILAPYRPFRCEANFSSGFSTREYGDTTLYAKAEPLGSLHLFGPTLKLDAATRILDIGCHLGYYGHHFLAQGVRSYTGVEFDERLFDCAKLIRTLAAIDAGRLDFVHGDFGAAETTPRLRRQAPYQIILSLASLNNIRSLTAALLALPELLAADGVFIIEYLALSSPAPVCEFHREGYRGDRTLYWIFSEAFLDEFLGAIGLVRTERLIEWRNAEAIGPDAVKIMAIYRKSGGDG